MQIIQLWSLILVFILQDDQKWESIYVYIVIGVAAMICMFICIMVIIRKKKTVTMEKEIENLASTSMVIQSTEIQSTAISSVQHDQNDALYEWLTDIDLVGYYEMFQKQGFVDNIELLYQLNDRQLKELGMIKMADRLQFLREAKHIAEGPNFKINKHESNSNNSDALYNAVTQVEINSEEGNKLNDDIEEMYSNNHNSFITNGFIGQNNHVRTSQPTDDKQTMIGDNDQQSHVDTNGFIGDI